MKLVLFVTIFIICIIRIISRRIYYIDKPLNKISKSLIKKNIINTASWFINFKNKERFLNYSLDLNDRKFIYSLMVPDLRKCASLVVLCNFYKSNISHEFKKDIRKLIFSGINHFINHIEIDKNNMYLGKADPYLAMNAFLLIAFITFNHPDKDQYIYKLGDTIVNYQIKSGENKGAFINYINSNNIIRGQEYCPPQCCIALMKLYNFSKNTKYLNSVKDAINYYQNLWNKNNNLLSKSWLIQALYELYLVEPDIKYKKFIYEISDLMIKYSYFTVVSKKYLNMSVGTQMEGLTESYRIAYLENDTDKKNNYKKALIIGTKNLLMLQVRSVNKLINYGYFESFNRRHLRVDWNQHALNALLKVYHYNVV